MIPVYKPYLPSQSLNYAHEALDSTWISSQGKFLNMATEKLQELLQVPYVILLNNGTSACHLVAKSLIHMCPVSSSKKKIIVPNNVYVAAWNAFLFDKEYELIPIDADLNTWNVDLQQLDNAINESPDADVLIVHNVGSIIDVPRLQQKYPNTHFVEDNCEGFLGRYGSTYVGTGGAVYTGTSGLASAISFFGNKNITSGEGGAFLTTSEELYHYAKCIQGQGQSSKRFVHNDLGYNYRMTNVQAAILLGQLEILNDIVIGKKMRFDHYRKGLSNHPKIVLQTTDPNTEPANWMFGIRVIGQSNYETAEAFFSAHGIEIRPMFYPITAHKHLQNHPDIRSVDCTNATILNKECFILPSYPTLKMSEQDYIIDKVKEYVKGI